MIVVAIIGILAALAIPAYSDYTIKAKVSEGASLSGAAKTAVDIFFSENGTLTGADGNSTLSLSPVGSYKSKYVSTVEVGGAAADGVVTVTLTGLSELGVAANQTIVYTPVSNGAALQWNLDSSSVSNKYRPKN